ncbi:MAG: GNAT family N-acetyltransferase [Lachnospiraceae bacterium]|nr:GNAT family N-acetyltransferase [Lachnospiraceae bacterium]
MTDYIRLQDGQLDGYAHMIPEWIMESRREGLDAEFWGMEEFGIPCGAAALWREGATKYLWHLYVAQEQRGMGKGSGFLLELLYNAYKEGCEAFAVKYIPGQFPAFERLLDAYPSSRQEEAAGSFQCALGELLSLDVLQGGYGNTRALSECTEESLRPFYRRLSELGEDIVALPVNKKEYLSDYSAVVMEEGQPAGMLLVREDMEGGVCIPMIVNLSKNIAAPIEMIRFAVQKGGRDYPPETPCRFAVVNGTLLQMLEKMGIKSGTKRCLRTIGLSYFAEYEQKAETYLETARSRMI